MTDHVANRTTIIEALRQELFGPEPAGREIEVTEGLVVDYQDGGRQPYRQKETGEEILTRDSPIKRYGVGVLFPIGSDLPEEGVRLTDESDDEAVAADAGGAPSPPDIDEEVKIGGERDSDDFDLSMANAYQPSSIGLSFLAEIPDDSSLVVEATGGRYHRRTVLVRGKGGKLKPRTWWLRSPVAFRAEFPAADLIGPTARTLVAASELAQGRYVLREATNTEGLDLTVEVLSRPHQDRQRLLTVCVVNRTPAPERAAPNQESLFQAWFCASVRAPSGDPHILPYPTAHVIGEEEDWGLELLYRHAPTFATGHGCAADWRSTPGDQTVAAVSAACLPIVQTPNITPEIMREDGTRLVVSMASLAGLTPDDGWGSLEEVVARYEEWIKRQRVVAADQALNERHRNAARDHLDQCERAAERMREGLSYLAEDGKALRAFQLANHAILLQQLITRDAARAISYNAREDRLAIAEAYQEPDLNRLPLGRGDWRAFQIAFLLASLRSTAEGAAPDRDVVELIWFSTGGGKTEAYLGLAAFGMFKRRLDDSRDTGVHVLMRYTLRLLTAQQFQRASGLICAMERLRAARANELGETPFSIGIWLGGDTTPNTRGDADKALASFAGSRFANNPFLLTRCPWCGAEFGRVETPARSGTKKKRTALTPGYVRCQEPGWSSSTVRFQCPDNDCPFSIGLPIYVVDDDIYEVRPTLVIGTIDKFAMLAWRPQAHALFGLAESGERAASPPGLIIQDELHLIAGPLGSLAGLYETAIEELCTDRRQTPPVLPKIVSSTATIRRFHDQILGLYARRHVALFPPPGLDAGDSFFARFDSDRPGRMYVGVHAVSLGSVQTEWVRTFTSLLQAAAPLDAEGRDPWWTVLAFFNSIREMGTAHTLFQSDIPDYARVVWERQGTSRDLRRYLRHVRELTGGLRSDEITGAIGDLEVRTTDRKGTPIDVCLASNIIEVGIDIPRLSLMVVAGQPKTTSQYIQVTGRVGRLRDRPGLVVTMYSPSKPRDRSHFERFRSYHERLYAHVEPTSVTPFSAPALDRALHAVLVTHARQQGGREVAARPWPYPERVVERFRELVLNRVGVVDEAESDNVARVLDRRAAQWRGWHRTRWDGRGTGEDAPLLRIAGAYASPEAERLSWATLMSMRNVDAECEAEITTRYIVAEDGSHA